MENRPLGTQSPRTTARRELTISLPARAIAMSSASAPLRRPDLVSIRTRASASRISIGQNVYEPGSRGFWTSVRWAAAPCKRAVAASSRAERSPASRSTLLVIRTVSQGMTKASKTPKANVTTSLETAPAQSNPTGGSAVVASGDICGSTFIRSMTLLRAATSCRPPARKVRSSPVPFRQENHWTAPQITQEPSPPTGGDVRLSNQKRAYQS